MLVRQLTVSNPHSSPWFRGTQSSRGWGWLDISFQWLAQNKSSSDSMRSSYYQASLVTVMPLFLGTFSWVILLCTSCTCEIPVKMHIFPTAYFLSFGSTTSHHPTWSRSYICRQYLLALRWKTKKSAGSNWLAMAENFQKRKCFWCSSMQA